MTEGHTIAQRPPLDSRDLVYISRYIGTGWEDLAHPLGMSPATIQQIKSDFPFNMQTQICKMLDRWQETNKLDATVASLFIKMHEVEEYVSIDWIELDKKFCNKLQHHQGVLREALGQFNLRLKPAKLLDCLYERDVLCIDMVNRIKGFHSTSEKRHEIIQYIYTKDAAVYSKFKDCLVECGQGHLANYLIELEHGTRVEHADCNLRQRLQSYGNLHAAMAEGHAPECLLTDKNLVDMSNNIGNGWESLAVYLKIPQPQIDHIKADHRLSMQQQIYNVLLKWKNTEGCSATLTSLLDKMINVPGVTVDWTALQDIFGPVVGNVTVFHKKSDDRQQTSLHVPINISQFSHIPGPSANVSQELLAGLQMDLINEYKKTCNNLQISPLFGGCTADLKKFYISPTLTYHELIGDVLENSSKSVKSYHEIFTKNSEKCLNIYISSEAGCGKTCLVKWMALNWCHAHNPVESDNVWFRNNANVDELKQFTFMFIIYLRNAPKDVCDIDSMIQKQLLVNLAHSETYSKLGLEFLQRLLSSERCLIVMDGLDEWHHPQSNVCEKTNKQVPHSKAWPSCTILTTTRPWKLDIAKLEAEDGEEIDHMLKLFDLKENLVAYLIDRVVNRMNELLRKEKKAEEFKELLKDKKLKAVRNIPIVVMQLLALWFDDEPLGNSWCEICCNMIEFLLKLYYTKKRMTVDETVLVARQATAYLQRNVHCNTHMELLIELGALAFYTLLGDNQESSLVFDGVVTKNFISDKNIKMALETGILTQENRISNLSQGSSSYIWFLHKTLQEFLAALYVGKQMPAINLSAIRIRLMIETFCCSVEKILEMSQMFVFLSGLCPVIMSQLSEHLKQVVSADIRTQNYRSSCDLHPGSSQGQLLGKLQYTMMNCSQEAHLNNHVNVIVPVCDLFIVDPHYGRHFTSWFRWSDELKFMVANISISSLSVHCVKKAKVLAEILNSLTEFISVQKLWLSQVPGTFVVDILSWHKSRLNMISVKVAHLECVVLKQVNMSYENLCSIVDHVLQLPMSVKVRLWDCPIIGNWKNYIQFHPHLIVDYFDDDDFLFDILFHTSTASVYPIHRNAESCRRMLQN